MRGGKVDHWPDRRDARRIYLTLTSVIMPFNVVDADGFGYSGHLIEVTRVVPKIRVVRDAPQIAFEMAVINCVEPHPRREQPPVRFGDLTSHQIALPGETLLDFVERGEDRACRFLVSFLRGRKTGAVNAVVDIGIDDIVDGIDLAAKRCGITPVKASKAQLSMRMISGDSLLTIVRRFLSHSTGTETRPV